MNQPQTGENSKKQNRLPLRVYLWPVLHPYQWRDARRFRRGPGRKPTPQELQKTRLTALSKAWDGLTSAQKNELQALAPNLYWSAAWLAASERATRKN